MSTEIAAYVRGFVQLGELTNSLPGTAAKFIIKCTLLLLMLNRIPSAETKAWICTADDCFNVEPQLQQASLQYKNAFREE